MAKFLDLITSFEGEWPHTRVSLRLGLFSIVTPIPRLKNRVGSFKVINRATVALTSHSLYFDPPSALQLTIQCAVPPLTAYQRISAGVDGGPNGGSGVHRPGNDNPHRRQRKLIQAACVRCHRTKCPLLTALFLFFLSFSPGYFSPRRGYHRVSKCMGF